MTLTTLTSTLAHADVGYELIPHEHTETAVAEARVLGVSRGEVAKTVVATDGERFVRAVVPASEHVDLHRLARAIGEDGALRLASEAELAAAYPTFELGAVPPFGGPAADRVVVDRLVAEYESVVFEAGTHEESLRLRTTDLLRLADAQVADISRP